MGMVGAQDRAIAGAKALHDRDVLSRIDLVGDLAPSHIPGRRVFVDAIAAAPEQSTTFERRLTTCVRNQSVEHSHRYLQRHASTIIAVPMPPPTHSEATPRPPPLA